MRRLAILLMFTMLVAAAIPVGAQSQQEVDEAEAAADAAARDARAAAAEHERLRGVLDATELDLITTQDAYRLANDDLEAAVLAAAQIFAEVEAEEHEVRAGRNEADAAIAEAYMQSAGLGGAFWLTDTVNDAAIVVGAFAEVRASAEEAALDLNAHRSELSSLHDRYVASQASLVERQAQLLVAADELDAAVARLGDEVARAFRAVEATDAAYRAAVDEVQEQQRRLNAIRGVEGWRTLVERHFPPWLVQQALEVMHCESRGNPDATHPRSGAAGLFQFLESTWAWASVSAGYGGASRYDPEANVGSAAWLVGHSIRIGDPRGPWAHWQCQPISG
jgi:hypothetical protein